MKTRIIHTKTWKDKWFVDLTRESKLLWLYLLTNDKINISGIYELEDREILFDTSIGADLQKAKKALYPKAIFFEGWVKVTNVEKYNRYRNSPLNEKAYNREMSYISASVRKGLEIPDDTSINTSIDTPINKELKFKDQRSEIEKRNLQIRNSPGYEGARHIADLLRDRKNVGK